MIDLYLTEAILSLGGTNDERHRTFLTQLSAASREGHLCIPGPADLSFPPEAIHYDKGLYYFRKNWEYQTHFLHHLHRLVSSPRKEIPINPLPALTSEQNEALHKATQFPLSIITGGPGTGKTFTAAAIAKTAKRVIVTAPTGKATSILEQKLPHAKAATLHRLLSIIPGRSQETDPVLLADLVLVDECSMIDPKLFSLLLSSILPGTHLVLMGDPDQLPPIEGGSFFSDLVDLLPDHVTHLTHCHRSDKQEILSIAASIRSGLPVPCQPIDLDTLLSSPPSYQILDCLRQGPLGVDALNAHFLKARMTDEWLPVPILITRTDETLKLYNGDTGQLHFHKRKPQYALFGERKFPAHTLPPYEYAYVLSVHKSQGSEYDHVILLAPEGSQSFGREILYTAATRARLSLTLLSTPAILAQTLAATSRRLSGIRGKKEELHQHRGGAEAQRTWREN